MENYNRVKENKFGVFYYFNSRLHRLDGPAKELFNGSKYWYQDGRLHRLDGPALKFYNRRKK
jgi:hypothetical protein